MEISRKCMEPSKESRGSKVQKKVGSKEQHLTDMPTHSGTWSGKASRSSPAKKRREVEKSTYPTCLPDRVHGR